MVGFGRWLGAMEDESWRGFCLESLRPSSPLSQQMAQEPGLR